VKHLEKVTPVAAALSAVATLACCLPVTFVAAAAAASLGTFVSEFRSWFIGGSAVLLAVAFVQLSRAQKTCQRRPVASTALFWLSLSVVLLVALFPQVIAGIVADYFS